MNTDEREILEAEHALANSYLTREEIECADAELEARIAELEKDNERLRGWADGLRDRIRDAYLESSDDVSLGQGSDIIALIDLEHLCREHHEAIVRPRAKETPE